MRIERRFTKKNESPYATIEFRKTDSEIRNPDGTVVFQLKNVEVPSQFSQVASDVLAQKYFRKAGVPAATKPVKEKDVPEFLWRRVPDDAAMADLPKAERTGSEIKATQVFDRLAGHLGLLGLEGRLFRRRRGRPGLFRRNALHARAPDGRAEQPAMVQHRPALGLWHRWPEPRPPLCRLPHRQAGALQDRL
jgi:ribonucleotide reductase alpha subunit